MRTGLLLSVCVVLLSIPLGLQGAEPGPSSKNRGFEAYLLDHTKQVNAKAPANISVAAMKKAMKDPLLAGVLTRRQFVARIGGEELGKFARANAQNRAFLAWLLSNTEAMDLYLIAAAPAGAAKRAANDYTLPIRVLDTWREIYDADPDSKKGIYLKLAIATALSPSPAKSYGSGVVYKSLPRYKQFKTAHKNGELFPSFDKLQVWDICKVVYSWASDRDLVWARNLINTWRPDLRKGQRVVHIVSEVWRRNSPYYPFVDGFRTVMEGGGKCGPRSWFGEMTCKAFGMPAMAMSQPGHSAIVYKSPFPQNDPQPGTAWKVVYGRGWHFTRGGYQLLAEAAARDQEEAFAVTEHLTWLASALSDKKRAEAAMAIVKKLQAAQPLPGKGPNPAVGADGKPTAIALGPVAIPETKSVPEKPFKPIAGVMHVEAETFTGMSGVKVYDCFTGGKQVNFQKNIKSSWIEYAIDAPKAGAFQLTIRHAVANREQVLVVKIGDAEPITVKIPSTKGLWTTTPPTEVKLAKGRQSLRISTPYQRGVAIRWLELKSK
jgi:hypothetical protein